MIDLKFGDCLTVMQDIPDDTVDMVLADPPYGITSSKWDVVIPIREMWEELKRLIKPGGIIALTASQPYSSRLVLSNKEMFRYEWIWIKNRGSNFARTKTEPMKEHEMVLIFTDGQGTYNRQMQERTGGGASRANYPVTHDAYERDGIGNFPGRPKHKISKLRVPSSWQKFNVEVGLHPNQKPVALMEYLIKTYTNEGDMVLDFAMGSGTTGVACTNLNRRFTGIENDENYFEAAKTRIDSGA